MPRAKGVRKYKHAEGMDNAPVEVRLAQRVAVASAAYPSLRSRAYSTL